MVEDDSLFFINEDKKFEVWCSVRGVFESVINSLEDKFGKRFSLRDTLDLKLFYDEKQKASNKEQKKND